jgi:lambda family phage minor tail protein L
MAYAAWVASNPYTVGQIARATTVQASGLVFSCTVAGTSAATEPAWPTDIGSTIVDGGVTWAAISSVYEELSVLAPNAIIELFQLQLVAALHGTSDIYYFHAGVNAAVNGNIVFDGDTYARFPIQAEGFEYSNTGTLPRPTLTVANLGGEISALLLLANAFTPGNDLGGAVVTRIRTLKKYLDGEPDADSHAKFADEIWYIDRKSAETRDVVQWELASKFDLAGILMPKRQLIANICQWEYRSAECSYTGSNYFDINDNVVGTLAADRCGKRLSSCKLRFGNTNPLPFGSFPGAGLTQ